MKKQRFRFTKNKLHPKPEFFVGQEVIITDNTCGHMFTKGQVVTLTEAEDLVKWWDLEAKDEKGSTWYFDGDDCKPYKGDK